ncbi:MAG: DUF4388 domain-containing protein [Myxococcota bacterium]
MSHVLVVHPDVSVREAIATGLRDAGYRVAFAESGERAIDLFVQEPSSALVVDLDLPGRDGAATIESIRWAPQGESIPVVLTGTRAAFDEVETVATQLSVAAVVDADAAEIVEVLKEHPGDPPTKEMPILRPSEPPEEEVQPGENADGEDEGRSVERRAATVAEHAQRSGSLKETPFPVILARLGDRRATGALVISDLEAAETTTGESPKKVIFFRNGIPRYVRSNLLAECLGQQLLQHGLIDRLTLEESLARVADGDGRQGGILVAMGAITPHQLRDALDGQLEEKLFAIFGQQAGTFAFTSHIEPPRETITLELSLAEIVLRGVRERIPAPRLFDVLTPILDRYATPAERSFRGLQSIAHEPEQRLLARINGLHTYRSLLDGHTDRVAGAQVLWAARCLGVLGARDEPSATSWTEETPDPTAAMRALLARVAPLLQEARYAEALGVLDIPVHEREGAARASAERLTRALEELASRSSVPKALQSLARETIGRVRRAEAALTNDAGPATIAPPAMREEITAVTEAPKPPDASAEPAAEPPHSEPAAEPPDSAELDQRVDRMLEAERHFRRGIRASQRERWEKALSAFARAVELVPDEGEFLVHQGFALFQLAAADEREVALERIRRGCRLVPKLAQAHLLHARALRTSGEDALARNAYELALQADPDCEDALLELRALGDPRAFEPG